MQVFHPGDLDFMINPNRNLLFHLFLRHIQQISKLLRYLEKLILMLNSHYISKTCFINKRVNVGVQTYRFCTLVIKASVILNN